MRHRLAACLFKFYRKRDLHKEVNKQPKIKTILNIAAVNIFPISMIQHQERQIKSEKSQPPTKNLRQNNVDHVVLYVQWKMH